MVAGTKQDITAVSPAQGEEIEEALSFFEKKDYETAEVRYRALVKSGTEDTRIHRGLAFIIMERGEYDEALQLLERAIELDPDDPLVLMNIGVITLAKVSSITLLAKTLFIFMRYFGQQF